MQESDRELRLADVDWDSLSTSFGPATGVPALVRALYADDPTARRSALADLHCLCHQETVYTASAAAVPALVRAARRAPLSPSERNRLLALVVFIGRGEDTCWEGYTPWDVVVACADAVAAQLPEIVRWAGEGDPEARRWSVVLAAYFPDTFRFTGTGLGSLLSGVSPATARLVQSLVDGVTPDPADIHAAAAQDEETLDYLEEELTETSDVRKAREVLVELVSKQPVTR